MTQNFLKNITLLLIIFNVCICFSQDYLVTKNQDTIYGTIEWKTNVVVYVKNNDGKHKFRADAVDFFQRGAFRFASIKTKFPEYLLEVKKGEVSYYLESHLKSKYTIDYEKKVFLKYKDELYPINVGENKRNNGFMSNPLANTPNNINIRSSTEIYSSNFKWSFYQILGKENSLYKLIEKDNYTFEDIELLVDLANSSLTDSTKFKEQMDTPLKKGYASGYIVPVKNDTIYGSLKLNGRFMLSEKLNFITKTEEKKSYKSDEVLEFKINNRVYKNDRINKRNVQLKQVISGEISLYRDLNKPNSYLIKEYGEFILVDKNRKYLELFKDKPKIYKRIIDNNYEAFEIKSMVWLYNNAPQPVN